MSLLMKIEGLVNGGTTPFDGQYLVECDPERDGTAPDGSPMLAHIITTADPAEAKRFDGLRGIHAEWAKVCQREPTRPDGKPNRPLTAFTISTIDEEEL